jgi:D-alanyl-D-alanine carboxypeptidase/D-alanyl-D-alanine-endopeptidase (penicillin-binding protein 4)
MVLFKLLFLLSFLFAASARAVDFKASLQETESGKALAANSAGHAYCELRQGSDGNATGYQTRDLVPLASVSKVMTSYWAASVLGLDSSFETKLHLTAITDDTFDLHLEGSRDPFMGRATLHFMMSELNRMGVKKIRHLTFDENFRAFLGVQENAHTEIGVDGLISAQETADNLRSLLNRTRWTDSSLKAYTLTQARAKAQGVTMATDIALSVADVQMLPSAIYRDGGDDTIVISLKSSPLSRYLKEMNIYSNNYIADALWVILGGGSGFQKFYQRQLNLGAAQIRFYTGSGLPSKDAKGQRLDNLSTCESVLQILNAFEKDLSSVGQDLSSVMMVGGVDNSGTLGSTYEQDSLKGAVVAKTGTIDPTKTLAGYVSTQEGKIFFGAFFRVSGSTQAAQATEQRDYLVKKLIREHGGKKDLGVSSREFLPFDKNSYFKTVSPVALDLRKN